MILMLSILPVNYSCMLRRYLSLVHFTMQGLPTYLNTQLFQSQRIQVGILNDQLTFGKVEELDNHGTQISLLEIN